VGSGALHPLWREVATLRGSFFLQPVFGLVSLAARPPAPPVAGGILADEMVRFSEWSCCIMHLLHFGACSFRSSGFSFSGLRQAALTFTSKLRREFGGVCIALTAPVLEYRVPTPCPQGLGKTVELLALVSAHRFPGAYQVGGRLSTSTPSATRQCAGSRLRSTGLSEIMLPLTSLTNSRVQKRGSNTSFSIFLKDVNNPSRCVLAAGAGAIGHRAARARGLRLRRSVGGGLQRSVAAVRLVRRLAARRLPGPGAGAERQKQTLGFPFANKKKPSFFEKQSNGAKPAPLQVHLHSHAADNWCQAFVVIPRFGLGTSPALGARQYSVSIKCVLTLPRHQSEMRLTKSQRTCAPTQTASSVAAACGHAHRLR